MGLFFDDQKPKVSENEYKLHVRGGLRSRGLSEHELSIVDMVFNEALYEKSEQERGISAQEIEQGAKFLNDNHSKYGISPNHVGIIVQELRKYL